MKRDMDLAREILRKVEACPNPGTWIDVEVEGRSPEVVSYHVWLLHDAGLIEAEDLGDVTSYKWKPKGLTWAGHKFLDAARDDTLWNKAKAAVLSTTGGLTFDLLKAWLKQEAAQRLGITL